MQVKKILIHLSREEVHTSLIRELMELDSKQAPRMALVRGEIAIALLGRISVNKNYFE